MGHGIYAEDFVCICLWLGNGDVNITAAELIDRSHKFEDKYSVNFGSCEGDFEGALIDMAFKAVPGLITKSSDDCEKSFQALPVGKFLPAMLNYSDIYWNDSDTVWSENQKKATVLHNDLYTLFKNPDKTEAVRLLKKYCFTEEKVAFYLTCRDVTMYNSLNIIEIDHLKNIKESI